MSKIVHAQCLLTTERLEELKTKTGETNTKDAISAAIDAYLDAPAVAKKAKKGGE